MYVKVIWNISLHNITTRKLSVVFVFHLREMIIVYIYWRDHSELSYTVYVHDNILYDLHKYIFPLRIKNRD